MQDPYYHVNQPGECPVCGLSFEHMHQDKNKPKEFIRGLATKNPPERVEDKSWWWEYTDVYFLGDEVQHHVMEHNIHELLSEHRKRVVREIRESIERDLKKFDGRTFIENDFIDGCIKAHEVILSLPELKE